MMLVLVATPLVIDAPFRSAARSAGAEICDPWEASRNTGLQPADGDKVVGLVARRQANGIFRPNQCDRRGEGPAQAAGDIGRASSRVVW